MVLVKEEFLDYTALSMISRKCRLVFSAGLALVAAAWLAGCWAGTAEPAATQAAPVTPANSATPATTPTRLPEMPATSLPPTATPTLERRLCSPLPGYSREQLVAMISNPYHPPPPGKDDPHEGIDLAVQQNGMALAGHPIQAMLDGVAAAVINDRFPYGNALMVETPLEKIPQEWLAQLQIPPLAPTLGPNPVLTCPKVTPEPVLDFSRRSLYLVYAHMQEKVALKMGDPVECGVQIGKIGQSGNALNPHLHLEARVGPSGVRFESLAHYDASATPLEMSNYCTWRVSGAFQLVNPTKLLNFAP